MPTLPAGPIVANIFSDILRPVTGPVLTAGVSAAFDRPWFDVDALIDLDFERGRFRFNGVNYSSLAAVVSAMGGTAAGNVLSVGPYDIGEPALYSSDFSAGIDGWLEAANAANGSIAAVGGNLVATATSSYSIAKTVTTTKRLAALVSGTMLSRNGLTAPALAAGSASNLAVNGTASISLGSPAPQTKSIVAGAGPTSLFVGASMGGTGDLGLNAVSAKEVHPYVGFTFGELSYEIDFTAPAAASGNKVLLQWGCADEDHRVRLVYDASTNLRQITTTGATEGSNLDLGAVTVETRHTARGSCKQDLMFANLDGGTVGADTSATFPPLGLFWVGRSATGETFDGTIHRVKIYAAAKSDPDLLIDPDRGFIAYGDSRSFGTNASDDAHRWYNLLAASMGVSARPQGNGGDSFATMLGVIQGYAVNRGRPAIITQYRNTGEALDTALQAIRDAITAIGHGRIYIEPMWGALPTEDMQTFVDGYNAALLGEFAAYSHGATDQAAFLAAAALRTVGDGVHAEDDMQAIQAAYAETFLTAKGWLA